MMKKLAWKMWAQSPDWIKIILRPPLRLVRWLKFYLEFGFPPPPSGTDLVGYETLLIFIERHNLLKVKGDIVEIGAFLGGGTYKISEYLERKGSSKKVYAIDIFDVRADQTMCTRGARMSDIYADILCRVGKGCDQFEIFQRVTRDCRNIVTIQGDSKRVEIPARRICFAFVDGNHDSSYIKNDFCLVWPKMSPGAVVAFHDYGYDLPEVTETIDYLLSTHSEEIGKRWLDREKHIIYIQKSQVSR